MSKNVKGLVAASLLAAMTCVTTSVIRIPLPAQGYIHLGDVAVLLGAWLLPPGYSALAAGLGAAMADLLAGYPLYAPLTFVVKATSALAAWWVAKRLGKQRRWLLLGGAVAEGSMVLWYFAYEALLYSAPVAAANLLPNALQGVASTILAAAMLPVLNRKQQ